MTSVTIPDNVTSIGEKAFGYYYNTDSGEHCLGTSFTIYGKSGSAAETFAQKQGYIFLAEE